MQTLYRVLRQRALAAAGAASAALPLPLLLLVANFMATVAAAAPLLVPSAIPPGALLSDSLGSPVCTAPCLPCSGMNVQIYQGVVQGTGCSDDSGAEVGVEAVVSRL